MENTTNSSPNHLINKHPTNPSHLANMEQPQYRKQRNIQSSATELRCRNHPTHRQSPGVCSVCLREKLHQIFTTPKTTTKTDAESSSSSSSSISSLSSSCSSSMDASPIHRLYHDQQRRAFVMEKSRSMASDGMGFWKKRSSGFWSNLVRTRSRRERNIEDGLMFHARSTRERIMITS